VETENLNIENRHVTAVTGSRPVDIDIGREMTGDVLMSPLASAHHLKIFCGASD
jgi:hypothetical protein